MSHQERFLLAGLMGWPVMHSRSPKIHGYWLQQHGLAGVYLPLAIRPQGLEAALRALPALGFAGVNLTIPHKEEALRIVDRVAPLARRIGAVNCIVVQQDGSLEGRNYDAFGFVESIRQSAPDFAFNKAPTVVIGAGGASRAILAGLIDEGVPQIRLINRSPARAQALAQEFGAPVQAVAWEERAAALDGAGLLVNTTSQGMVGEPPLDLNLSALPVNALVVDIVYVPLQTPLLREAAARGNRTVDGLGMLLHQARPAFEDWFGVKVAVTAQLRELIVATL
jgi:shikimate dehydrogenase